MRKKRMLAFLMAACLALTPAMAANAGSVDNLGGHESLSLDTVSNGNGNLVTGTQPGAIMRPETVTLCQRILNR